MSKTSRPTHPLWKPLDLPPLTVEVVGRSSSILAINKPVGMDTIQINGWKTGYPSLMEVVYEHYPYARFLNRIDRDTSGVVLFAETKKMRAYLASVWFGAGSLEKRRKIYLAVISTPEWEEWETDTPLKKAGKFEEAHSKFKVLKRGTHLSLVSAELVSHGRTHQLRKHLALAGHPILGDTKYGGERWLRKGQLLHSWKNEVKLEDGSWERFWSKCPTDWPLRSMGGSCLDEIEVPCLTPDQQVQSWEESLKPRRVAPPRREGEAYPDYLARRNQLQKERDAS
jgi:23S rRNA pseudouridine955/2504/2580 synthase